MLQLLCQSVLQEYFDRHLECRGDVEEPFIEQPAPTMLDIDQHIAGHARTKGQLLLCHVLRGPDLPNAATDRLPNAIPCRDTLRIVLARSRGHAPK